MTLLPNHLRANRKRLALSQGEAAFLLGAKQGSQVSRYEHFNCVPLLETALTLEVIYKRPVSELFGGLYQKVEREVAERAKVLAGKKTLPANKREALKELADIGQ